ncbi:MAG: hypothetical protein WCI52_00265 [bacterium]
MNHLIAHEPSQDLEDLIMKRIIEEERKRAVRGVSIFSVFSIASLWGSISLGGYLWSNFYASGFFQFASLVFSDWSVVLSHGSNFMLSLAESFPVIELSIFLAAVVASFWSVSYFMADFKIIRTRRPISGALLVA